MVRPVTYTEIMIEVEKYEKTLLLCRSNVDLVVELTSVLTGALFGITLTFCIPEILFPVYI